jgi:hypothetical protein
MKSKDEFIKALAEFLVNDQGLKSIQLEVGGTFAKEWAHLRSTTPLFGYPTVEEAEQVLRDWLLKWTSNVSRSFGTSLRNYRPKPATCGWYEPALDENGVPIPLKVQKKRGFQCGTAACLGGWTEIMASHEGFVSGSKYASRGIIIDVAAENYLGLTEAERGFLFISYPSTIEPKGWKRWMLKRLDGVIQDKEIRHYVDQMRGKWNFQKADWLTNIWTVSKE